MVASATGGSSVALFYCLKFKIKGKTVGVARQQLRFLCSDKENEAKESLALRWACLAREGGNLNSEKIIQPMLCTYRAGSEALESLSFCVELYRSPLFSSFSLIGHTKRKVPL